MKKLILLFTFSLSVLFAFSQRTCGTMDYLQMQLQNDPNLAKHMQEIETQTALFTRNAHMRKTTLIVTIPVVVHVIYKTSAQNISDAQVQSQIDVLNRDYRKLNFDTARIPAPFKGLAADIGIEFALAKRDPSGNATTGITRTLTTKSTFSQTGDPVKYTSSGGHDAWPASSYLNLWCCALGNSLLGYAQFPGGAAATDGVVILYSAFGSGGTAVAPYNLGRTATHEVGHWLNLRHIWGDATCGDDLVFDTPTQQASNYGCKTFPKITCSNGPNGDMFMNYMDYVDDSCMQMFSQGQSTRMAALFASGGARVSLLSSLGATPLISCYSPANFNITNITTNTADLSWDTVFYASTGYIIKYKKSTDTGYTTLTTTSNALTLTGLSSNTSYDVKIAANCAQYGTSAYTMVYSFTSNIDCLIPSNLSISNVTINSATLNWKSSPSANLYLIQIKRSGSSNYTNYQSYSNSLQVNNLAPGTNYEFNVSAYCTQISSNYSGNYIFSTQPLINCWDRYEPNETKFSAPLIRTNTFLNAKISSVNDCDWYSFENDSVNKNISLKLSNLPLNYDLYLYGINGNLILSSKNSGLNDELITFNTNLIGTYYVKINGAGRAFTNYNCYQLTVNTTPNALRESQTQLSISDELNEDDFNIYPNPTSDKINLTFSENYIENRLIKILDVNGKELRNLETELSNIELDLTTLSKGLYIVEVSTPQARNYKRLVIE